MADKIQYDDLFDPDILKRLINEFKKAEKDIKAVFARIKKDAKDIAFDTSKMKKMQDDVKRLTKLEQELNAAKKAQATVNKQLEQANARLLVVQSKESQQVADIKEKTRRLNREKQLTAKVNATVKGSYDRLNAEMELNMNKWRKLSKAQRENSAEGKKLTKTIQQQDKELKKLDAGMGRHQRNVGNYPKIMGAATKALGAFGIMLGGTAIIGAFKSSLAAFDAQEKAVGKVRQALISTSNAAGRSLNQLTAAASNLQSKTIFGDEEILNNVTAQLLTFTNITGTAFDRTQKVALDLSTVLDGDLKSASIQLGKALNDPVANLSALSRSGIQFSTEQKNVIKELATTNRLAEAQSVILDELERQYGGQAEAAAKLGLGSLQQLGNVFGDVTEKVGGLVSKFIGPLVSSLKGWVSVEKDASKELDNTRVALNQELNVLKTGNFTTEQRAILIGRINKEYKDYLPSLIDETASLEDIEKLQKEINNRLLERMVAMQMQEEIAKLQKEQVAGAKVIINAEKNKTEAALGYNDVVNNNADAADAFAKQQETNLMLGNMLIDVSTEKLGGIEEKYKAIAAQLKISFETIQGIVNGTGEVKTTGGESKGATPTVPAPLDVFEDQSRDGGGFETVTTDEETEAAKSNADYYVEIWRASYEGRIQMLDTQLANGEIAEAEHKDRVLEIKQEQADAELEIDAEKEEKKKEIRDASIQGVQNALDVVSASYEVQLNNLERQKEYELSLVGDNEEQKAKIEEKYRKKQNQAKRKQAIADKTSATFGIVINTALGIVKTGANLGYPLAIPFQIIQAALGIAQAAVVASKPVPQFAKGTDHAPGGWSITGEKGEEILVTPDGNISLSGGEAEVRYLEKGTKVIPHDKTQEILDRGLIASFSGSNLSDYNGHLDFSRMEDLQRQQVSQQRKTNDLLGRFRFSDGKSTYDIHGNKLTYV